MKEIKKDPGVRITWIGLLINVGIALGKFVGGIVFHSQALLADSVHAASDLISDILTLFSVRMTSPKPTEQYPYGKGKIETVGSLAVSSILAMAGVSIGWSSLCAIVGPIIPHTIMESLSALAGHGHSHVHAHGMVPEGVTNINAAWIAGGSIVVKEWIFQATKKIAISTNSNVLMANAWHHRVDSLTSLVALVAITSSYFFHVQSLDAIGGLLVSWLVVKAGGEGIITSLKELTDQSVPRSDENYVKLETIIRDTLNKVSETSSMERPYSIKDLVLLNQGRYMRAKLVVEVPIALPGVVVSIDELERISNYLTRTVEHELPNIRNMEIEFRKEKADEQDENNNDDHDHNHERETEDYHEDVHYDGNAYNADPRRTRL